MTKKTTHQLPSKGIEKLLNQQTIVILNAVDEKIGKMDKRFNFVDHETVVLRKKLEQMEMRVNQKIGKLTTSIDKFLKKSTDLEDEFTLMKADLKRVKTVLREKLGVTLD